ncbi:MAG: AMP-binding protein, partial [Pseudomonadota bacterium]
MTLSYVSGVSDAPLLYKTIGAALEDTARQFADKPALISREQGVRLTYSELNDKADDFAAALLGLGLAAGERIGIWAPNCAEWVITQLATA